MARGERPPARPGPVRWLWYALTGRLPPRYREWVLYDLTCPTWPLRHLARLLVPLAPLAGVLIAVLPGPLGVRATGVAIGSVVGLLFTFVFLEDSTDRRATKFGYPSGTPRAVREHRARDQRERERRALERRDGDPLGPRPPDAPARGVSQRGAQPLGSGTPQRGQR